MNRSIWQADVLTHLTDLTPVDRALVREDLEDLLNAVTEEHGDGDIAAHLGSPGEYAARVRDDLATPADINAPQRRLLGAPVEFRGPFDASVRSRMWNPADPSIFVPHQFGIGWSVNFGAVAVRLGLIRPDDAGEDVIEAIPDAALAAPRQTGLVALGAAALVAGTGDDDMRANAIVPLALSAAARIWAHRPASNREDQLIRGATSAAISTMALGTTLTDRTVKSDGAIAAVCGIASVVAAGAMFIGSMVGATRSGLRELWSAND